MKPVIREYLASLRERDELDAVLPDLLSEMGFTVYSRPSRGPRQYGVDVAAVGPGKGNARKLYLFSIKQGDLTRANWDDSEQGLRPSLNEILDVYIRNRIPSSYTHMKVVICLCFGGDIHENVRDQVTAYTDRYKSDRVSFEEWNGDHIAGLIEEGLLREELLPEGLRPSFRKAVALVDEPDISFGHFATFVRTLVSTAAAASPDARITATRQICICLWILFVWARDAGNLESPYRASELAMLLVWQIVHDLIGRPGKRSLDVGLVFCELVDLHFRIWDELVGKKIIPHAGKKHAISAAIRSASPVDVNLKLFDLLGRIALRGLWLVWSEGSSDPLPAPRLAWKDPRIDQIAQAIRALVSNNPALLTPVADEQVIDLSLALMFLTAHGDSDPDIKAWVRGMVSHTAWAFKLHSRYPCVHRDYRDLVEHPRQHSDEYREEATSGSVLYPVLAIWAAGLGDEEALRDITEFKEECLSHCNFQLWVPHENSEASLYTGAEHHGGTLSDIPVDGEPGTVLSYVVAECVANTHFSKLSAVALGHWPIVALACRHHRLPVPPHLWADLLPKMRQEPRKRTKPSRKASPSSASNLKRVVTTVPLSGSGVRPGTRMSRQVQP